MGIISLAQVKKDDAMKSLKESHNKIWEDFFQIKHSKLITKIKDVRSKT